MRRHLVLFAEDSIGRDELPWKGFQLVSGVILLALVYRFQNENIGAYPNHAD